MVSRTDDHRYYVDISPGQRRELLGVTRVISENGLIDDTHFGDRVRSRGKLSHEIIECMLRGRPAPEWFVPYLGYMRGMRAFLDRHEPEIVTVEEIVSNIAHGAAGTLDFSCIYLNVESVFDIKLSEPTPWHGVQLAAYTWMKYGKDWIRVPRFGLYLGADGSFRPKQYGEFTDLDVFLRALDNSHWRVKHGSFDRAYGRSIDFRVDDRDAQNGRHVRGGVGRLEATTGSDRDESADRSAEDADQVEWYQS